MEKVKFSFDPKLCAKEVRKVGIVGDFLFYESNLTGHSCETGMADNDRYFTPHEYREGLEPCGMRYYEEMKLNSASGLYEIEFDLPAGLYQYRFAVGGSLCEKPTEMPTRKVTVYVDGELKGLSEDTVFFTDDNNPPSIPSLSGQQNDSVIAVGNNLDHPWLPGLEKEKCGFVSYISYLDIDGKAQSLGIYLPANFSREKTYPVIYVSHGGGGNEADWYHQGGIHHIMDNLISEGKTEEAILVTMNNSVYNWDFKKIADNLYGCIIPFVEMLLPVSPDMDQNAFCGLSMGSMTTLYMYMHRNAKFRYFGAFSGGIAGGEHFSLEDPALAEKTLFIGCGEEDIAWNFRDIGIPPTLEALKKKGLPFIPYFVPGGHDWYCWPQMFTEFAENVLWK